MCLYVSVTVSHVRPWVKNTHFLSMTTIHMFLTCTCNHIHVHVLSISMSSVRTYHLIHVHVLIEICSWICGQNGQKIIAKCNILYYYWLSERHPNVIPQFAKSQNSWPVWILVLVNNEFRGLHGSDTHTHKFVMVLCGLSSVSGFVDDSWT